jgi:hypothetical protein
MPAKKSKPRTPKPPSDPYLDIAWEHYGNTRYLYDQFADKRPVMLFDIQERRIYCYPYKPFAADLSKKSQRSLAIQYREACKVGHMVLFIRDNVKRVLKSYSMPINQP